MKQFWVILCLLFCVNIYVYPNNIITVISVDGSIGPATTLYIKNGIDEAIKTKSEAIILKLNTPGGLLESTRDITGYMLESLIPIIVYVSPSGARAGSAGVFITLASHISSMAPGTNIGAAHPVGLTGNSDNSVLGKKNENDAVAYIKSIAEKRNKNSIWAEYAVRESISSTENEALEKGVINFISKDLMQLIKQCDGQEILINNRIITLDFKNVKIVYRDMNWKELLLNFISNPNVAYLLILLSIYGIFFELKSPGSIFPGTVGGISILLASYSLQMMEINYIGLGLIILAFIFFVLEIFIISYGMLSIGGIISLTIGSVMLIDSPYEYLRISMIYIIIASMVTGILIAIIIFYGYKSQKSKILNGKNSLIGQTGICKSEISPTKSGVILVQGEIWNAISEDFIKQDDKVDIISVDSMILTVKKTLS